MSTVRKILKHYKVRPRKRLGQSFLEDDNVLQKIIQTADLTRHDVVVEVGAGLGILTEQLANRVNRAFAIEVDPRMIRILKERLREMPQLSIIERDVLSFDFSSLQVPDGEKKLKIIGNIPYNITTQLIYHLLGHHRHISSILFLLQEEVADRILAAPGTKAYGIPSVVIALYAETKRVLSVPASCFYPQPRVNSSLVTFTMRSRPLLEPVQAEFFKKIVRSAFAQRRKTLLNNLRSLYASRYAPQEIEVILKSLRLDGMRRAETLSVWDFISLSRAMMDAELAPICPSTPLRRE